jgi:hypothetical protein
LIHIVMDIFEIVISIIKHILYVIIIMLIYEIKMTASTVLIHAYVQLVYTAGVLVDE